MTAAERIIRFICRLLPPSLKQWGEAMAHEAASIEKPGAAIAFALSCGVWAVREALGHALRSVTSSPTGPADPAILPPRLKLREAALMCAIAATGLGLIFLADAGAPASYLIANLTALMAGLIIVLPFRRRDLIKTPFVGVVAIAAGLILLMTATFGEEVSDTRRWLPLGGVMVQPSLIGLPFMLVAFARSRDVLTTAGLILAAAALALQPDRAMAGVMVAGIGVVALMRRDPMALLALLVALACFIATMVRPDAVLDTSFADGLVRSAPSTNSIAGLAVWGGIALLLLPTVLGLRKGQVIAPSYAAFGATWLAIVAAAIFSDASFPVVAYGGSAIVGYVWSILALPADASRSKQTPVTGPNSRVDVDCDMDNLRQTKLHPELPV